MNTSTPFKWCHFQAEIILLCVRWVQHDAPELEKRCRLHLKMTNDSWRVDETYVKVKRAWMYLYRAVDSQGNTLEFLLSPTRDAQAAKRFFAKALAAPHTNTPRVITVDKTPCAGYLAHPFSKGKVFALAFRRCDPSFPAFLPGSRSLQEGHGCLDHDGFSVCSPGDPPFVQVCPVFTCYAHSMSARPGSVSPQCGAKGPATPLPCL